MHDRHLLVTLDGSSLAESALPVARVLANALDADVTLFTAVSVYEPGSTREPMDYLEQVAQRERDLGVDVRVTFRIGDPTLEIEEFLSESAFDMIVLATHGRSGPPRGLFGSVADQVLQSSRVPVVVLHPNHHAVTHLGTVLVPLDGTPGAAVALATAVGLARAANARLVLVRVSVPPPISIHDPTLGLDTGLLIDPMWAEDARRATETYVVGMASRLEQAGLVAEGLALSALPAAGIVAAANQVDADFIVMSSHARSGAARSVLGSVTDEVVRKSRRPVVVVRRDAPETSLELPVVVASSSEADSAPA
jgi:nucleotide-binding universal stress UspA family protein